MAPINIRGNVLDPANPGDVNLPPTASDTDYVLVQLNREMDQATMEALHEHRAGIIKRMVDNTWLVHYPPADIRILETSIPAVAHAFVYVNDFVVHTDLKNNVADVARGERQEVSIALHENARPDIDRVIAEVQGLGNAQLINSKNGVLHMIVNSANIDRIAALDSVQAIETVTPAALYNNIIKEISGINSTNSYLQKNNKPLLTGEGQVVGIADTGVNSTHPAFKDKIADKFYLFGAEKDEGGHGTHVSGTILGSPMTSFDSKDCAGMAPGARLCLQGGMFREMPAEKRLQAAQLFDKAYKIPGVNCRIHNNSWGSAWPEALRVWYALIGEKLPQFAYTIDNAEPVDQFAIEHPDFLILFAAGNDGGTETDTGAQLGGWAAAKNVLTVGATNTSRPMSGSFLVDYSVDNQKLFDRKDTKAYRRGTIAPFSSIGPCKNSQRTKPDVLAPGAGILSARSKDVDPVEIAKWVKDYGAPPDGMASDQTIFMSGTSMATPAVSGYAALLREALAKWQSTTQPAAPLMKAFFINGTDVLPNTPRAAQGFGEINMIKVLRPVHAQITDITAGKAASGWTQDVANKNSSVKIVNAVAPPAVSGQAINIKITLVYHDRPGDQIQNRMNLFVERAGKARLDTLPTTPYDNVHQLIVGPLTAGESLKIGVETKLFVGGALPLQGSIPWALVWDWFYVPL